MLRWLKEQGAEPMQQLILWSDLIATTSAECSDMCSLDGAHHMAGGWADTAAGGTGSGMLFNLQVKTCSTGGRSITTTKTRGEG